MYEPINPTNALYITKTGIVIVVANTRVTTKNLNGFAADTSMASICSVTFIDPNSAPICDPTLPAQIKEVISGANALITATPDVAGNQEVAPKLAKAGREWSVKTIPTMKPVTLMRGRDL